MLIRLRMDRVPEMYNVIPSLVESGITSPRFIRCDDLGFNSKRVQNRRYSGIYPEMAVGGVGAWRLRELKQSPNGYKVVVSVLEEVCQGDFIAEDFAPQPPYWKVPRHVIAPLTTLLQNARADVWQMTLESSWINVRRFEEFQTEGNDHSWLIPPDRVADFFEALEIYPVAKGVLSR